MIFQEPAPTAYDLKFSLGGIPVTVNPMFWVTTAMLSMFSGINDPRTVLIWVGVSFFSILAHELGHALVIRRAGMPPRITLYGFGGLASYPSRRLDPRTDLAIALGGPMAGFLITAIIGIAMAARGEPIEFQFGGPEIISWRLPHIGNPSVWIILQFLLYVNLWWSLVNLLPVFPLDGSRAMCSILGIAGQRDPLRKTLEISVVVGAVVAVFAIFVRREFYMALMFGYLAFQSYQQLVGPQNRY